MIGSPDGADDPGHIAQGGEQNAAAVIWAERGQSIIGARRPAVLQVSSQRDAADVHDSQMIRQGRPRGEGASGFIPQIVERSAWMTTHPQ